MHPLLLVNRQTQLGAEAASDKVNTAEINAKMKELTDLQARIDDAILALPQGPDRLRVIAARDEARSWFSDFVMPAYNALLNAASSAKVETEGWFSNVANDVEDWWNSWFETPGANANLKGQMGWAIVALPVGWVVAAGIVATASTALYYINAQIEREKAILNDPAFTAAQKKELIEGGTLYGILGQAKWLAIAAGVGAVGYVVVKSRADKGVRNA